MPRPGLSYDDVKRAAEKLSAAGKKPTINRVRETLGGRGSSTTISRYLKEWKAKRFLSPTLSPYAASSPVTQPAALGDEGDDTSRSELSEGVVPMPLIKNKAEDTKQDQYPAQSNTHFETELQPKDESPFFGNENLQMKIRRLESTLNKEQVRRIAAERLANEAKDYANAIKEQVGHRIQDLKTGFEQSINQLRLHAREVKYHADKEIEHYRKQLEIAQKRIEQLMGYAQRVPVTE